MILYLLQIPGSENRRPRFGWLIRETEEPSPKDRFLSLTGDTIERPSLYQILLHVPGYPANPEDETKIPAAMTLFLEQQAFRKINDHLVGRIREAATNALFSLPYENALWILKATPEELESWAIQLAGTPTNPHPEVPSP